MKAWVVTKYKQPLELTDLPEPSVEDHDVLVDIHAAAVNLLDVKVQAGEYKAILPYKAPFGLGHDLAGAVIAVAASTHARVHASAFARRARSAARANDHPPGAQQVRHRARSLFLQVADGSPFTGSRRRSHRRSDSPCSAGAPGPDAPQFP